MGTESSADLGDAVALFEEVLDRRLDLETLADRLVVQKLVYLARTCGLALDYEYDRYQHGPYSSGLADDCHELAGRGDPATAADGLDRERFERLVAGSDEDRLEYAATVHSLRSAFADEFDGDELRDRVVARAANMKEESVEAMRPVYDEVVRTAVPR